MFVNFYEICVVYLLVSNAKLFEIYRHENTTPYGEMVIIFVSVRGLATFYMYILNHLLADVVKVASSIRWKENVAVSTQRWKWR